MPVRVWWKTHRFLWCALALVLCCAPVATATVKTWIDDTGQWNVSGNWDPSGQPQGGDNAYLTQSDATNRTVTCYNTNPTEIPNSLAIHAAGQLSTECAVN